MAAYNFIDMTGRVFGRHTVIERVGNSATNRARWLCQCECGTQLVVGGKELRRGSTQSCGCLSKERRRTNRVTHGKARTPEYNIWTGMLKRCRNPNDASFGNYGGRGIRVCERWNSFENFIADMGPRPPGLTLERRDNAGDYSPENCCWAAYTVQARNRRNNRMLTANGETKCMAEWTDSLGGHITLVRQRLRRGWSIEDACTRPI